MIRTSSTGKVAILLTMFVIIVGCSDDTTTTTPVYGTVSSLPEYCTIASCAGDFQLSGGDLVAFSDRIVAGRISEIAFVTEISGDVPNCSANSYNWTLKVSIAVDENLKGTGDILDVLIRPERVGWCSVPTKKVDGGWLPDYGQPPAAQVSSDLGWTKDSGLQVGQEILVFARADDQGVFATAEVPWGLIAENHITFQSPTLVGDCVSLPVGFESNPSLDDIRTALATSARPENGPIVMEQRAWVTSTTSVCHAPMAP